MDSYMKVKDITRHYPRRTREHGTAYYVARDLAGGAVAVLLVVAYYVFFAGVLG